MHSQCSVLKINFSVGLWVCIIIVRENKRFQQQISKRAAWFFSYFLLENETQTDEKNTVLRFSIKSETTCKNSAHLDEKKNGPKFDIEWLCSDVFSWLLICTNSLSPHLRFHYPPPPPPTNKKSPGYMYICLFTDVSPGRTDVCSESCGMFPTL